MEISNFIFNGISLADVGMIPGSLSEDNQSMTPPTLSFNVTTTPTSKTKRFVSSKYEDTVSFEIGIVRNPCESQDARIDIDLDRFIRRWLIREDGFKQMIFECDDYENIYVNCYLNLTPVYYYGSIVGYTISGSTDSPYVSIIDYKQEFEYTANTHVAIPANSDEIGFIYPKVEIKPKQSASSISFQFVGKDKPMDSSKTVIENVVANTTYTLDSDRSIITGLTDPTDFNWVFPKIVQTWDETEQYFICSCDCDVKVIYTPRRKVIL